MNCPNCGHDVRWHKGGCHAGDRSWTCGCKSTRFHGVRRLTEKEREIYRRGFLAGRRSKAAHHHRSS